MTALEEIAHLADVRIPIAVELDRKMVSVREILEMEPGNVIRMTRSAGENIDLLIGHTLLGVGEIVIIENTMGIRITDLSSDK